MMKTLLVTGGAGFIGSNFCHYWAKQYPEDKVVVLDALTYAGHQEYLSELQAQAGLEFVHGDIRDYALLEELFAKYPFDHIVHFAAESHVDRSITGPDAFIETNIIGTHNLLKLAKQYWIDQEKPGHRFHHVSTDEVYGSLEADDPAFSETTAFAPNSPYSASKAASDHLVRAYHHTYGLNVSTSNCSNNYGPRQDKEKLIPLIIHNILHGKQLPIYGDGMNIRDWLYVDDHCYAIDLILQKGNAGEVYNVGGENEWANLHIVELICDLIDKKLQDNPEYLARFNSSPVANGSKARDLISFVKDRAGHDRRYAIDPGKCHAELNYHPKETFETGIAKTLDWYLTEALKA
ncbi:dTDP-glucose 4,6-dehydratase [Pseudoteredinibacter isoporae]